MSTLYLIENEVISDFLKNSLILGDFYRGIRLVSQSLQVQFRLKGKEAEESTCRERLPRRDRGWEQGHGSETCHQRAYLKADKRPRTENLGRTWPRTGILLWRGFCPPRGHLMLSGDNFDCLDRGDFWRGETRDAGEHPTMHRTAGQPPTSCT